MVLELIEFASWSIGFWVCGSQISIPTIPGTQMEWTRIRIQINYTEQVQ